MKIPKSIHFTGKDYEVIEQEGLDCEENLGRTHLDKKKIFLEKNLNQQTKEETLIHEMLHIAYRHTGAILSHEDEEKIVNAWARNIYGILKDNNLLK